MNNEIPKNEREGTFNEHSSNIYSNPNRPYRVNDNNQSTAIYCDICAGRGMKIENDMGRDKRASYLCFDCYEKERNKNMTIAESWLNIHPAQKKYLSLLREYYLKPLFYGELPDMSKIREAEREWSLAQLANK